MVAPLTSGAKRGAGVHDEPDLAARPQTLPVGGTASRTGPTTIAPASPQRIA
jgi:hypothetical protein